MSCNCIWIETNSRLAISTVNDEESRELEVLSDEVTEASDL